MGRQPKVRIKNGRWYSEAGGKGRYFGRVDAVSEVEATAKLWAALATEPRLTNQTPATVAQLSVRFVDWVARHRSEKTRLERERHLGRFVEFAGRKLVKKVDADDLEKFTARLRSLGHAEDYVAKHLTSVKAMFRRGVRLGWIEPVDPFARFEPVQIPPKSLREADLPTAEEVQALIRVGDDFGNMGDLIRLYHATGARTYELLRARVGDFEARTRAIVLTEHKRSKTLREPTPRVIHLNDQATALVERHRAGRPDDEPLFTRPTARDGRPTPYSSEDAAHRFRKVRRRAKVRDGITLYSFRHLWISEALMSGLDSLIVARMAGTSTKMIEQVYGRFRLKSFQEAQAQLDALRGR